MNHLLLTNQFKFSINIVKIIMKIKDRITYNSIFAKEMCILSIKDASKYKKSIISNWFNKAIRINRANCHYIDKVYPGEAGVKKIYIFCTSLVIPPPLFM